MSRSPAGGCGSRRSLPEVAVVTIRFDETRAVHRAPAICQQRAFAASRSFEHTERRFCACGVIAVTRNTRGVGFGSGGRFCRCRQIAPLGLGQTGRSASVGCRRTSSSPGEHCLPVTTMTGIADQRMVSAFPSSLVSRQALLSGRQLTHKPLSHPIPLSVLCVRASDVFNTLDKPGWDASLVNRRVTIWFPAPSRILCVCTAVHSRVRRQNT